MSSANIGGDRPLRVCDPCAAKGLPSAVDDHPRHSIAGTIPGAEPYEPPSPGAVDAVLEAAPASERARLMADLYDRSTTDRHLDCCAEAGCPLEHAQLEADRAQSCPAKLAQANGATGKKLLAHLESRQAEFVGEDA